MSFLIRLVHVGSVSLLLGGAIFLILLFELHRARKLSVSEGSLLDVMSAYEWAAWASMGLIVMTGVGNLSHFGAALPDRGTEWGGEFLMKMSVLVVFLLFSLLRTTSVALLQLRPREVLVGAQMEAVEGMYVATVGFVVAIVALAIALSHF